MDRPRGILFFVIIAGLAMLLAYGVSGRRASEPVGDAGIARSVAAPRAVLGAGGCATAGCHAAPIEGHLPWESAYTVWATHDRHTRAYEVLREPLAQQIITLLSARDPSHPLSPAHENKSCLGCHTTVQGARASEGVSCESCHGPAGDWLVAHTLPGWQTRGNSLGMVDLADPYICATQCGQCHIGAPPAADGALYEVSHDMIAAGHPRLVFNLRSFKQGEPPHWRDRFAAGDGGLDVLDEVVLGRLGALDAYLAKIEFQAARAMKTGAGDQAGVWPEFTAFDCYGCHRQAIAQIDHAQIDHIPVDRSATATRPLGRLRLEPMRWALTEELLPEDAARTLAAFRTDVEATWWQPPRPEAIEACRQAVKTAQYLASDRLKTIPDNQLARLALESLNVANWDEVVIGAKALNALTDRLATHEDVTEIRQRLAAVRTMLEFPEGEVGGRKVRFDSPHDYDPAAVRLELEAIVRAIESRDR